MGDPLERNRNYFEQLGASVPSPFGPLVRQVLDVLSQPLEWVAGDPDALVDEAHRWVEVAPQLREIATEQAYDRGVLSTGWGGDGQVAFDENLSVVEEAIRELAELVEQTGHYLVQAADVLVAVFNLIVEIILTVILFLVSKYIVAAALAVVTFGASIAAATASTFATMTITMGRLTSVIVRLQAFAMQLAMALRTIQLNVAFYSAIIQVLRTGGLTAKLQAMLMSIPVHAVIGTGAARPTLRGLLELYREGREAGAAGRA